MRKVSILELKGTVALVTGGAKGLGLAITNYLHQGGAAVWVLDKNPEALAALPEGIASYAVDIINPLAVKECIKQIIERHQRIHILVNNAGIIYNEPLVNIMSRAGMMHDYDKFRACMTANLDSVFIMTSAVVEQMMYTRTKGVIVNISSISACGNEGQTAYSAAKAGVNAMSVTWSKELGRLGIRCNAIAPGFIATDSTRAALNETTINHIQASTPLRRLGLASEVAEAVGFLISNDFVNGVVLDVNGGLRF